MIRLVRLGERLRWGRLTWVSLWLFRLLLRKYYCCGGGLDWHYHSGGVAAVVLGFYYRLEWIFLTFLEVTHGEMCKGWERVLELLKNPELIINF